MTDDLVMAEECIDRQAKTEVFDGRTIETATGRVLLHALGGDGLLLCGRDLGAVSPTGRRWGAAYLPHVPRCQGCVSDMGEPSVSRTKSAGRNVDRAGHRCTNNVAVDHAGVFR
jgi:hypothetical protein